MTTRKKNLKRTTPKGTFQPNAEAWDRKSTRKKSRKGLVDLSELDETIVKHNTPFGLTLVGEGFQLYSIKHKDLFADLQSLPEEIKTDPLARLIHFEKLATKYPNEPFLHYQIAGCYLGMKKQKKYEEEIIKNYQNFKGYPDIDIEYFDLRSDEEGFHPNEIFGEFHNLHLIYPKEKAFDKKTVIKFYDLMSTYYRFNKNYELARKCGASLNTLNYNKSEVLIKMANINENPKTRWMMYATTVIIVLVVLSAIIGGIYAIIKFLQWIF